MIAERGWSEGDLVLRYHRPGGSFPDESLDGGFQWSDDSLGSREMDVSVIQHKPEIRVSQ